MKNFLTVVTILFCMTCAGCLQGGSTLIITNDGKVFMRNKLIGVPVIAEQIESFRQSYAQSPNAEISPVVENNMSGYEVRVNYPSIEAFAAEGNPLYSARDGKCFGIRQRKGWFFDAYSFDLVSTNEQKFSPSEAAAVQSMLSQVTFDLTIELPYSAESHNADKVDAAQKVLTWNLAPVIIGSLADKHMRVEFKLWHREKIFVTALVETLLLAATIFFTVKTRAEESDSLKTDLKFKRNIFAGLFVALILISAYMLLTPVAFTEADTISAVLP